MTTRNLSGVQFRYTPNDRGWAGMPGANLHSVEAVNSDNELVGHIEWDANSGRIGMVHTAPEYRKLGVATAMWQHAHTLADVTGITPPQHSSSRTLEGDLWAKKVGGKLPKNRGVL